MLNKRHNGEDKDIAQFFSTIETMPSGPNFTLLANDNSANSTSESVTFIQEISTIGVLIKFEGLTVVSVYTDLRYDSNHLQIIEVSSDDSLLNDMHFGNRVVLRFLLV